MFLPLHDKNPLRVVAFQFVTVSLMLACLASFLWQLSLNDPLLTQALYSWGMVPAVLIGEQSLPAALQIIPEPATLISYQFLHSNWSHLLGNLLFLWVFGDNVEDAMGHVKFIVFYLTCGALAAVAHVVAEPGSEIPLIGASGAISGLLGAYLILHPRVKILVLLLGRIPLRLPAYLLIISWGFFQYYQTTLSDQGNVAWWAHLGGFVAGMFLVVAFRNPGVPLFDHGRAA